MRDAFLNALGKRRCFPRPKNTTRQYHSAQHFQEFPEERRRRVVFVSGHFTIQDLDLLPGFTPCMVLREPADRAVSVVWHFMRHDPAFAAASFRETLDAITERQIRDFYRTRLGASAQGRGDAPIDAALAGLSRFGYIGFFEDGVDRFARRVAQQVFGIDLDMQRLNAAPGSFVPDAADLARIRELTALDAEIYSAARAAVATAGVA
jgi:hypothetical protein